MIHLEWKKNPTPKNMCPPPRLRVLHPCKTGWIRAAAEGAFPLHAPPPISPALLCASAGICAIRWWEIRDAIWPTPPMVFFPSVSFTVYHSHSYWHQRGGRNTWLGPPFSTPAHTQAGLKQSQNSIFNNVGKKPSHIHSYPDKKLPCPSNFFHLNIELRWLSAVELRGWFPQIAQLAKLLQACSVAVLTSAKQCQAIPAVIQPLVF